MTTASIGPSDDAARYTARSTAFFSSRTFPRPGVSEKQRLRAWAESRKDVLAERARNLERERIRQRHDVRGSGAERRNRDDLECEPVEQIGPERPVAGKRRQIDVRRADHPHVELNRPPPPDPLHLPVLDDPEHLLLHRGRRVRDLVEQQGAAVRTLEAADVLALRAGECPCFVAEQLGVEQRLGERRAVDLHQRSLPAGREVVQPSGEQLLAGAPFADHEARSVDGGEARDLLFDLQERRILTEDGWGNSHGRMVSEFAQIWRIVRALVANSWIERSDTTQNQSLTDWHAVRMRHGRSLPFDNQEAIRHDHLFAHSPTSSTRTSTPCSSAPRTRRR